LCCLFRAPGATPLCPLSLHDALPILTLGRVHASRKLVIRNPAWTGDRRRARASPGAVVCGVLAAPIRGAVAGQRHPREVRGRPRTEGNERVWIVPDVPLIVREHDVLGSDREVLERR